MSGPRRRFVGRGGEKLDAALDRFGVDVAGRAGARRRRLHRRLHRLPPPAGRGARWSPSTSATASSTSACAPTPGSRSASAPTSATSTAGDLGGPVDAGRGRPVVHLAADGARRPSSALAAPGRRPGAAGEAAVRGRAGRRRPAGRGVDPRPRGVAPGARRGRCARSRAPGAAIMGVMVVPAPRRRRQRRVPRSTPGAPARPRPPASTSTPSSPRPRSRRPARTDRGRRRLVVHHERPEAAELAARPPTGWSSGATRCACRRATPSVAGLDGHGCADDDARRRPRPGREPRRRRHHAAHRRPRGRRRRARARRQRRPARLPHRGRARRLRMALERFLAGDYDDRGADAAPVASTPSSGPTARRRGAATSALNEAVLEKTADGPHRAARRSASTASRFTTYAADGLIVATPTGSTAYAFSARGPDRRARTTGPCCSRRCRPHMLFDRSLVLDPGAGVRLEVAGDRPATLSVDGRNLGDARRGRRGGLHGRRRTSARLVDLRRRATSIGILKAKFGLERTAELARAGRAGRRRPRRHRRAVASCSARA